MPEAKTVFKSLLKRAGDRGLKIFRREAMENIKEIIRNRRSVRTFDGKEISASDLDKLTAFLEGIENPYGIPVAFKLLDAREKGLSSPVISGANLYVGAKVPREPYAEEALGYSFEMLVLYAWSIGIGTVWIGGTFDRAAFERAMELEGDEKMPCASPLGYPAKKMSLKENMMRKAVRADNRLPFESLFFDGDFGVTLSEEKAGRLAEALEMVRWAPSAVNKQPWRVVVKENNAHFFLKKNKGFVSDPVGNMQKIDMGIALCHFDLTMRGNGLNVRFDLDDPKLVTEADTEYIATYHVL